MSNNGLYGYPRGLGLENGLLSLPVQRGLWTPAQASPLLWLDPSDSSTLTITSGAIEQCRDISGYDRHFEQTVSGSRPIVSVDSLNGRKGMTFDGTNDFLRTNNYALLNNPSETTMLFVVSESSGTARRGIIATRPPTTPQGWVLSYSNDTANPSYFNTGRSGSSATGASRNVDINVVLKTATQVRVFSFLNASGSLTNTVVNPAVETNFTVIGAETTVPSANFLLGTIYEIFALPTNDVFVFEKARGYLAWRWGLTANLPTIHPYKNLPPLI
jgi:hypothetical protein